jgi:ribosome-associated toxin RatA of RatAB toxin-antitoxin module
VAESAERMFALINDVESYPQFVPWCTAARVDSRSEREVVATLSIKRGPLALDFTTRNVLSPAERIDMQLERGPFRRLGGGWVLVPLGDRGCRIELALQFEFANRVSAALFEPLFEQTAASLVDAFVRRARQLRDTDLSR